ncbi:hypothetical protein MRY87_04580 [bacterium]|nr:hypothetical protein [bacterium]
MKKNFSIYPCYEPREQRAYEQFRDGIFYRSPNLTFFQNPNGVEPFSKVWLLRTFDRIKRSDLLLCFYGETTWLSNAIQWELFLGAQLQKEIIGIHVHRNRLHIPPFPLGQKSRYPSSLMQFSEVRKHLLSSPQPSF